MNLALKILAWLGIGILGIFMVSFIIGFIINMPRVFARARGATKPEGSKYLERVFGEGPVKFIKGLPKSQVLLVGVWYLLNLAVIVLAAFSSLSEDPIEILYVVKNSPIAMYLTQCYAMGTIGAIMYGILRLSKVEVRESSWLLRRYLLLPILGGFLGAISYFFLKAGLITVQGAAQVANNSGNTNFGVYAIAFLSGFASRELTAKLIIVSRAIFAKVEESDIIEPKTKPPAN